jgi:integrase
MKFDVVETWINNIAYSHSGSPNTAYHCRHHLKMFCDFIGETPQQILDEYEVMNERDFRRKYAMLLRAFISEMSKQYVPGSLKVFSGVVKSFFKYNDLPLGYVPLVRDRITYHNRDITREEIVEILKISDPRDRAFFCMMAQSGLRPETICNLTFKLIQPDFDKGIIPCKIEVPQEIAKGQYRSYFTFVGEETIKHLKDYLKTRPQIGLDDYLFTKHGDKNEKLNRASMSHIFRRAANQLKQKGIMDFERKQAGKPAEVRLYNLRKFFRKYAGQAGFENVQFWMGHIVKEGDEEHYRPQDPEFYRQSYKERAMPFLRLDTETPTETDLRLTRANEEIERLKTELENERNTTKAKIDKLEADYEALRKQILAMLEKNERTEKP